MEYNPRFLEVKGELIAVIKKILVLLIFTVFSLASATSSVFAQPGTTATSDIGRIFGSISPPPSLSKFIAGDPSGAKGIGNFLSNLISLIYIFATIALLFMLLWGAFDWITSEGEKEKINAARGKIINAIIGLMLFAVVFAFLRVLGTFTGFTFFSGQNFVVTRRNSDGEITGIRCTNKSYTVFGDEVLKDPESLCR